MDLWTLHESVAKSQAWKGALKTLHTEAGYGVTGLCSTYGEAEVRRV